MNIFPTIKYVKYYIKNKIKSAETTYHFTGKIFANLEKYILEKNYTIFEI